MKAPTSAETWRGSPAPADTSVTTRPTSSSLIMRRFSRDGRGLSRRRARRRANPADQLGIARLRLVGRNHLVILDGHFDAEIRVDQLAVVGLPVARHRELNAVQRDGH